MTIDEQLEPLRAIAADPPACLSEVRIDEAGPEGEVTVYFLGTWRDDGERRRYVCVVAWPDDDDTHPDDVGKLVAIRSDSDRQPQLFDPTEIAGMLEANADWLMGGAG